MQSAYKSPYDIRMYDYVPAFGIGFRFTRTWRRFPMTRQDRMNQQYIANTQRALVAGAILGAAVVKGLEYLLK